MLRRPCNVRLADRTNSGLPGNTVKFQLSDMPPSKVNSVGVLPISVAKVATSLSITRSGTP